MSSSKYLYFNIASAYAEHNSGCTKVKVGSLIERNDIILAVGANVSIPNLCAHRGCLRIEKYGNDSKKHRNPEDCRSVHSEIDAITTAANAGVSLKGASIWITRYPCEACARAIVRAGIKAVHYGRQQVISQETSNIFEKYNIDVYHHSDYDEYDVER